MGDEHPDWLPLGWRVSVKARSSGKKDKYYVNPSSGLKFNSKPEVLRHVKSSGKDRNPKELNMIDIEKTVAKKLPPGWIKEIRTKKKGGRTRRDPYYIDPVSGRHFRSMPEVFRYLESEDTRKAEPKSDEILTGHEGVKSGGLKLASGLKGLEQREKHDSLANELSDKLQLVNRVEEDSKVAALKKVDMTIVEQRDGDDSVAENLPDKLPQVDDSVAENLPDKLPQVNVKGQYNGGRRQSRRLADIILRDNVAKEQSLQSGSEDAVEENINMLEDDSLEQRPKENNSTGLENLAHQNKRKNSSIKWTSDLPRRTSKRLARVEIDPLLEAKPSKMSGEPEVGFNDSNDRSSKSRTGNPTNKKQKKPNKGGGVESKEEEKHLESSLEDLLMDPCIEFAIKTLTGAIPIEDVIKVGDSPVSSLASPNNQTTCASSSSSSVSPSVDIWADPCFEFAVKTLTGDIPMEEGSQFQISFRQPMSSLTKFSSDNVYPLSYSFGQFDAVKKPFVNRQQGVRDLPFPHAINGGSQKSVDN